MGRTLEKKKSFCNRLKGLLHEQGRKWPSRAESPGPFAGGAASASGRAAGGRGSRLPTGARLYAEKYRIALWRSRIGGEGFRVGIAWQGNPSYKADRERSIPLRFFEPLSKIPGVRLISLQKHDGLDQLKDLPPDMTVETLSDDFDDGADAFIDTAAVMTGLDLIITSDTAVPHLAGALVGAPVWTLLSFNPDWRWMLDRDDSPWYPSMRLFRQETPGDWEGVFQEVETALRNEI